VDATTNGLDDGKVFCSTVMPLAIETDFARIARLNESLAPFFAVIARLRALGREV
jgi:hypothetical protein